MRVNAGDVQHHFLCASVAEQPRRDSPIGFILVNASDNHGGASRRRCRNDASQNGTGRFTSSSLVLGDNAAHPLGDPS